MATEMRGVKFKSWKDGEDFFRVVGSHFKFYFKHEISEKFKGFIKALPEGFTIQLFASKDKKHPDCIFVHRFVADKYKVKAKFSQRRIAASDEITALESESKNFRVHSSNRGRGVLTGGTQTMGGIGVKRSDKTLWKKRVNIGEDI